jgi:hypothetical protein
MSKGPPKGTPKVPGSGRQAGVPNKVGADVRALARGYGAEVIEGLWTIFSTSESDATRVAAAKEILDRAYGRPPLAVSGDADGEPVVVRHIVEWLK